MFLRIRSIRNHKNSSLFNLYVFLPLLTVTLSSVALIQFWCGEKCVLQSCAYETNKKKLFPLSIVHLIVKMFLFLCVTIKHFVCVHLSFDAFFHFTDFPYSLFIAMQMDLLGGQDFYWRKRAAQPVFILYSNSAAVVALLLFTFLCVLW